MSLSLKGSRSLDTVSTEAGHGHSEQLLVCVINLSEGAVMEQLRARAVFKSLDAKSGREVVFLFCSGIINALGTSA